MDTERTEHLIEVINEDIRRLPEGVSDLPASLYRVRGIYVIDGETASVVARLHEEGSARYAGSTWLGLWDNRSKTWRSFCDLAVKSVPWTPAISDEDVAKWFAEHRDRIIAVYTGMLDHVKRQRAQLKQQEEETL